MEKQNIVYTNSVGTEELNSSLIEGFTPKSTMKFYDISKEEYHRVVNSESEVSTKIGKNSPVYEDEN